MLGKPIEEEQAAPGSYQNFEGGVMLWSPSEGGIYLWVRSGEAGDPPRALGFPYRRHLHELVVEAMRKSSGGARQGVRLTGKAGGGGPNESFNVFDLQRPELTDKDHHSVGETNQMKE